MTAPHPDPKPAWTPKNGERVVFQNREVVILNDADQRGRFPIMPRRCKNVILVSSSELEPMPADDGEIA